MSLLLHDAPIPHQDAIGMPERAPVGGKSDISKGVFVTAPWIDWLSRLGGQVSQAPTRINSAAAENQNGSISPTDVSGGGTNAGLYRLSYYVSIDQAAGTSSSLIVTFNWTQGGVAKSKSFPAIVNGTSTTTDSQNWLIGVDGSTPITYSTTYASSGAPVMVYSLNVVLEGVQA